MERTIALKGVTLKRRFQTALLIAACVITGSAKTHALEFDFQFIGEAATNNELQVGMRAAADEWSRSLADPVNVVVDVRVASIHKLGFAKALTFSVSEVVAYGDVRDALIHDATSVDDQNAVNHLPNQDNLTFRANDPDGQVIINNEQRGINGYLDVARANAKALSLPVTGEPDASDAEIVWNKFFLTLDFDLDRSDGITGSDFVGAAMHELGHALGFLSGVDDFDESSLPNGPFAPEDLRDYAILNVPDLFRLSPESLPNIDLAFGGEPYFSIDGGQTPLGHFATGYYNGDGGQAGHWLAGQGIMDEYLREAEVLQISELDVRMMDVIGWDTTGVPEPATAEHVLPALILLAVTCRSQARSRHDDRSAVQWHPPTRAD